MQLEILKKIWLIFLINMPPDYFARHVIDFHADVFLENISYFQIKSNFQEVVEKSLNIFKEFQILVNFS